MEKEKGREREFDLVYGCLFGFLPYWLGFRWYEFELPPKGGTDHTHTHTHKHTHGGLCFSFIFFLFDFCTYFKIKRQKKQKIKTMPKIFVLLPNI